MKDKPINLLKRPIAKADPDDEPMFKGEKIFMAGLMACIILGVIASAWCMVEMAKEAASWVR